MKHMLPIAAAFLAACAHEPALDLSRAEVTAEWLKRLTPCRMENAGWQHRGQIYACLVWSDEAHRTVYRYYFREGGTLVRLERRVADHAPQILYEEVGAI